MQHLAANKQFSELTASVRREVLLGHCPICRYKCNDKSYINRHACFQHAFIKQAEPAVRAWARSHSGVGKPCKWCQQSFPQEPRVHLRSCVVLWTVGHLVHKFSSLQPPGESTLRLHGRGTCESSTGTATVRGPHPSDFVPEASPSLRAVCTEGAHPADSADRANGHPLFDKTRRSAVGGAPSP